MPTVADKEAFSKRLLLALRRSPEKVDGATELALRFNLRYHGEAISPQTAHKWLTGKTIPTSDKLTTLAEWLNVTEHWLHYGPPPAAKAPAKVIKGNQKDIRQSDPGALVLAEKIHALTPHSRYLLEELVERLRHEVE